MKRFSRFGVGFVVPAVAVIMMSSTAIAASSSDEYDITKNYNVKDNIKAEETVENLEDIKDLKMVDNIKGMEVEIEEAKAYEDLEEATDYNNLAITSEATDYDEADDSVYKEVSYSTYYNDIDDTYEEIDDTIDYKNDLINTITANDISDSSETIIQNTYTSEYVDDEDFQYIDFEDYDDYKDFCAELYVEDLSDYPEDELTEIASEYLEKGYNITDLDTFAQTFNRCSDYMGFDNKYFNTGFQITRKINGEEKFLANIAKISNDDFKNYARYHFDTEENNIDNWEKKNKYHYTMLDEEHNRYGLVSYNPQTGILVQYVDYDAAEIVELKGAKG